MNLELLAERACLESGYNDTDDLVAAKKFARHWDEHIWNSALWKASLVAVDVSVTPDTDLNHAAGIVYLPEVIDRVVGVRTAANQVLVEGQQHYYRMDYDAWAQTGSPHEYVILPGAWFTYTTPEVSYLQIQTYSAGDDEVEMYIELLDRTGERRSKKGNKSAINSFLVNYTSETFTILRMFKSETESSIVFIDEDAVATPYLLTATQINSPAYNRIRLVPIPTDAQTVSVLGKAKYEPLEFDQQEPALHNLNNCLLAFIRASLNRRGGEMGKAQAELAEANALLQEVMKIEARQAANHNRILPFSGYGPEYGLGPSGYLGL